jgi:hypothetical protein
VPIDEKSHMRLFGNIRGIKSNHPDHTGGYREILLISFAAQIAAFQRIAPSPA